MKRFGSIVLAAAFYAAGTVSVGVSIAASPAPSASSAPASPPVVQQLSPQEQQLVQYANAYKQLQVAFGAFQQSVYAPWCSGGNVTGVALIGSADKNGNKPAWPAVINCKDGKVHIVKSPLEKAL